MNRESILSKIRSERVVALIRANSPDGLMDCARALADGFEVPAEFDRRIAAR